MCILSAGCTKKIYLPVETTTYRTDTIHHEALRHDSIAVSDSIFILIKGDTIYKSHTLTRDRLVLRTDTLYRSHTDTVHEVQIREVPCSPSRWQSTLSNLGLAALIALGLGIAFTLTRWFRPRG